MSCQVILCEVFCQNKVHVARYDFENFEKTIENDVQGKKRCEFESNLCNIIITSSKEVVFMKICCVLISLNRIIIEDPE